jgi:hypothetical protein
LKIPLNQFCKLDSIIEFINSLNEIPSPTDREEDLLEHITELVNAINIPIQTITRKPYLNVPPVLVGNPDSKYILVTHCDRVIKDKKDKKVRPLSEISPPVSFNYINGTLEGKLDNTVSLAVCLYLMLERKPKNTSLLITTAEELSLNIENPPSGNLHKKGGRGFISFLQDNIDLLKWKQFICVDVRPVDRGGGVWFQALNRRMNIGDGLVLRLEEHRPLIGRILNADNELVDQIRTCATEQNVNLIDFTGPEGTTELGRGWEKLLHRKDIDFPRPDYHIAWVQPPIRDYHTSHEKMSGNDVVSLCKVIHCLISTFEK